MLFWTRCSMHRQLLYTVLKKNTCLKAASLSNPKHAEDLKHFSLAS